MSKAGLTGGFSRAVWTALALGMGVACATAQDQGTSFGLKGGVNLASFGSGGAFDNGDRVISPGRRTGLILGAFVAIPVGPSVLIQPEAVFTQKGARYTAGTEAELVYAVDYLEVPLLLKVRLGGGATRGALFGGPAVAFRLNGTVTSRDGEEESSTDVSEMLRTVDWGVVFGGGIDVSAGSGVLTLEGRYTLGLSKLGKDLEEGQTRGSFNPRNGVLSFLVGYAF